MLILISTFIISDIIPFASSRSGVNIAQKSMLVLNEFEVYVRVIALTTDYESEISSQY